MSKRCATWYVGIVLLLLLMSVGLWAWPHHRETGSNKIADVAVEVKPAALHANNRGIVLMEQFHIEDAISEFEEAVRQAPDWLPARINLEIALLHAGAEGSDRMRRCRVVFEKLLRQEPDNPHAHFCLGRMLMYQNDSSEAVRHFEAVLQKDPDDAYSWYWLGSLKAPGSAEQTRCLREAIKRNRHLSGALFGLFRNLHREAPQEAERLIEKFKALQEADWESRTGTSRYGEMGPYAEVIDHAGDPCVRPRIGPLPRFHPRSLNVRLAGNARWASSADLDQSDVDEVRRLVRKRFGATMAVLDYDHDHNLDLFQAGAVIENGRVRDLLLRNDGDGRFTDVTAEAGLAEPRPTLGCVVADFDNDGHPDLLLTGIGVQKLFRNTGKGAFEDVTVKAGLDKLTSVCLGAAFVDLDHDGARDLLICEYAATARQAVDALKGVRNAGGLAVFLNVGTAPEVKQDARRPALSCAFRRRTDVPGLNGEIAGLTNLAVSDLDGDDDLDLLLLADQDSPTVRLNDRLIRFRGAPQPLSAAPAAAWNGALVLDADHDGRSDLLLIGAHQSPRLLLQRTPQADEDGSPRFMSRPTNAPPLRQAVAVDLDLDSWTDAVGLTADGEPVLLHNVGGWLKPEVDLFAGDRPRDVIGVTVCDIHGKERSDVILWSETEGLRVYENKHNNNNALHVELTCTKQRDHAGQVRCSADGFGTRVMVHAGAVYAAQEWTTLSAGLGQSWQPLLLGMERESFADAVRLRWPDGTRQAEQALLAGRLNIIERQQRRISC
jgi:tetratricopeptide (TPR) repeat protein